MPQRYMINPETGKTVPMPDDRRAVADLKGKHFSEYEYVIDTTLGRGVPVGVEGQVGGGIERLLKKVRRDEKHEGQPAFMLPQQWERLTPAERAAFKPEARVADSSLTPKIEHIETIAMQSAQIAAQAEKMRELEAKLAAMQTGRK